MRLIPARAGKTDEALIGVNNARGSSPRGRGKRQPGVPVGNVLGLIPARAGKTAHTSFDSFRHEAHPRAGGEN